MVDIAERLRKARMRRYESARQAAIALGMRPDTYIQYENGLRGFSRHADKFARFFRVNLDWLITGRGEMDMRSARVAIPVTGLVAAGSDILPIDADLATPPEILLPEPGHVAALIVEGDSGWPRFLHGETILYDPRNVSPESLIGKVAIVQALSDGRRMIKTIQPGRKAGTFTLESYNAAPERDVALLCAWKFIGLLSL